MFKKMLPKPFWNNFFHYENSLVSLFLLHKFLCYLHHSYAYSCTPVCANIRKYVVATTRIFVFILTRILTCLTCLDVILFTYSVSIILVHKYEYKYIQCNRSFFNPFFGRTVSLLNGGLKLLESDEHNVYFCRVYIMYLLGYDISI